METRAEFKFKMFYENRPTPWATTLFLKKKIIFKQIDGPVWPSSLFDFQEKEI